MIEHMHAVQVALEREMKRRRVRTWGGGYPLDGNDDLVALEEPALESGTEEVQVVQVKRKPTTSRWRVTLNLIRLSLE